MILGKLFCHFNPLFQINERIQKRWKIPATLYTHHSLRKYNSGKETRRGKYTVKVCLKNVSNFCSFGQQAMINVKLGKKSGHHPITS